MVYIIVDKGTKDRDCAGAYRGPSCQVSGDFTEDHSCALFDLSDQLIEHKWQRLLIDTSFVALPRHIMCSQCELLCRYNTQGNAATGLFSPFTEFFFNITRRELVGLFTVFDPVNGVI